MGIELQGSAHGDTDMRLSAGKDVWREHIFRNLLNPAELAAYEDKLKEEICAGNPIESDPGNITRRTKSGWSPSRFPGHLWIYNILIKSAYYLSLPVEFLMARMHGCKPPADCPLRVLRIVSMITQGGVAKVCLQSILAMPAEAVRYHLLVFAKNPRTPELDQHPHIRMTCKKLQLWPGSYHFKLFWHVFCVARIIRKSRAHLIHLHEPQFTPVVRMAAMFAGGVPVCVQLHSDYTSRRNSIRDEVIEMTRHSLRKCRLIACSETIRRAGEAWLSPIRHPIALVQDGADDNVYGKFGDTLDQDLCCAAGDRVVVAMMSHLIPLKRIGDFMQGCRQLLDEGREIYVILMSYGKTGPAKRMKRYFNRTFKPGEGEFLFKVRNPQRLVHRVGIGVSTSSLEGLGLNILEYQAAGVPVVCTNLPAHREMVVHGQSGLLYEPCHVDGLVNCVKQLLDDATIRQRIGRAGQEASMSRKWTDTARETLKLYQDVLASGSVPGP